MNTDKQLLLKDLSARLPYNVICYNTLLECNTTLSCHLLEQIMANGDIYIKPFLRPLSNMTEEEKAEYCDLQVKFLLSSQYPVTDAYELFDYLNEHHFDYKGLIEKGLALKATEGMYDFK